MLTEGATFDFEMIYALFTRTAYACKRLGEDAAFAQKLNDVLEKLPPLRVSERYGTICEWIRDYEITYPVVFNWEPISDFPARTDGVKAETVTQCAQAFCRTVEEAGYIPMVYFNKSQGYSVMNLAELKDYHFSQYILV